jgi:DnaJ-class molecular chaperone
VVLNVLIPRNLTERQQELLRELRDSLTEDNLGEPQRQSLFSKVRRAFG